VLGFLFVNEAIIELGFKQLEENVKVQIGKAGEDNMKKILVVDDEELITKSLLKLLTTEGYNATVVRSGKEAIEKVKEGNFDLIISDVRMPGIDGIETIKQIRSELKKANKRQIPEIVITGYADKEQYETAMTELKVKDYIFKPFERAEFLKAIKNTIG
jgi:CheY-like chemotaxis protein